MKTIKPLNLGVLCRPFEDGEGCRFCVAVIVFFPFEAPRRLLPEVELWKFAAAELGKDAGIDACMPKTRGEVLVHATAYPPNPPQAVCAPRVRIGTIDKSLYVAGHRHWQDADGVPSRGGKPSKPLPFHEMPISWENAFGGPTHAQNPLGKGIEPIDREGVEILPLPNVEDPRHVLATPNDRPMPAGFGPYDFTWPQRYSKVGTYDEAWLSERFPGFAKDMDWGVFNTAPEDQQLCEYFRGDESFVLEHMHPDKSAVEGTLPGVVARAFVNLATPEGEAFTEVAMRLDTVLLFPRAARGIAVFHGTTTIAEDDAADVLQLMIAAEAMGEPKPLEHYRTVLAQRLDKDKGYLHALRDADLMPPKQEGGPSGELERELDAAVKRSFANARRGAEQRRQAAIADLVARGLDPVKYAIPPLPEDEPIPSLEELGVYIEGVEAKKKEVEAQVEEQRKASEEERKATLAEHGFTEKMKKSEESLRNGPPDFTARGEMAKLHDLLAGAKNLGVSCPGVERMLADPGLEARLLETEKKLLDMYRAQAHRFPPARRRLDEAAALREEVRAAIARGESLANRDLTGADLSGLDLSGADLRGALLECANLANAGLAGATLEDAVLVRADLTDANLAGSTAARVNLGGAKVVGTNLGGCDLTQAIFHQADLSNASFAEATLTEADLSEAVFRGADFSRVVAHRLQLIKSDLGGLVLAEADLSRSIFLECIVEGVDFGGAKLPSAVFLSAKGDRARFDGADLNNLRVVAGSSFADCDFTNALLAGSNLRGTNLARSDFSRATMTGADLSECSLVEAKLRHVAAHEARFVRADLTRADAAGIDMLEGSLQHAKIGGTSFAGANLFRVDFAKAKGDTSTNLTGANTKHARFTRSKHG